MKIISLDNFMKIVNIHHNYLKKNGPEWQDDRADFTGFTFKGMHMKGFDLCEAIFKNCVFEDCIFVGSNFYGCNFDGASFKNCEFYYCDCRYCNIKFAYLESTLYRHCNFEHAVLKFTRFKDVNCDGVKFGGGTISNCYFYPKCGNTDECIFTNVEAFEVEDDNTTDFSNLYIAAIFYGHGRKVKTSNDINTVKLYNKYIKFVSMLLGPFAG